MGDFNNNLTEMIKKYPKLKLIEKYYKSHLKSTYTSRQNQIIEK